MDKMRNLDKIFSNLENSLKKLGSADWYFTFDGKIFNFQIPPMGNLSDMREISLNRNHITTSEYWRNVLAKGKYGVYQLNKFYNIVDETGYCLVLVSGIPDDTLSIVGVRKADYLDYEDNLPHVKKLS